MYGANGNKVEGMPYDLFCEDAAAFQREVADVVAREGTVPKLGSVNKQQWHLAILRAGEGKDARAVWLDYDSGGGHGHFDGMNLGLFAKGLDLMPDFGYPPVQYGGWTSPRGQWYGKTAAHNTVAVNGENQQSGWDQANVPPGAAPGEVIRIALNVLVAGHTTIWADGKTFRAIRASGPDIIAGKRHEVAGRPEPVEGQFERTVAMADVSESDSYIADVFRVVGGADHAKFTGSHFAKITTQGLSLSSAEDYGYDTQMRNFQADRAATPGWSVDWKIDDRYGYLAKDADVHLRYTDLTEGAEASTCEAWVNAPAYMDETWIPRVMVRRRADVAPLSSTFVDIIEPYEGASNIAAIHRLSLETADGKPYPDTCLAVEIGLADGRRDLLVSADVENPLGLSPSLSEGGKMVQKEWGLATNGELC
jgi:hypothetical protein